MFKRHYTTKDVCHVAEWTQNESHETANSLGIIIINCHIGTAVAICSGNVLLITSHLNLLICLPQPGPVSSRKPSGMTQVSLKRLKGLTPGKLRFVNFICDEYN